MPGSRMKPTIHGYAPFEVISTFQKEVRRGNEEHALYWAAELWRSGYDQWLWARIMTIAVEDCDPDAIGLVAEIKALYDTHEWLRKRAKSSGQAKLDKTGKMHVVRAVMNLCRAKKSREVDHANGWFFTDFPERLDIPDYAFDMHTQRGKQMGRGLEHFMDEGTKLNNRVDRDDPYEERFRLARGKNPPPVKNPPVGSYASTLGLFEDDEEDDE